jgi:hypothetical protein
MIEIHPFPPNPQPQNYNIGSSQKPAFLKHEPNIEFLKLIEICKIIT